MRIPVVPLTVRVTLLPRAHQATPERPQLAPTEPRQPAHPRLVLMVPPLPAPPRLVLMAHPLPERLRLALMVPLQRAPRPPALPLLALMAPRQLALLPPEPPLLARTAGLLATVLLAARPLLPCATTVWVSAVHRLRLLRRRSQDIYPFGQRFRHPGEQDRYARWRQPEEPGSCGLQAR